MLKGFDVLGQDFIQVLEMGFLAFYAALPASAARSFGQGHGLLEKSLDLLDFLLFADYPISSVQIVIYFPGNPALLGIPLHVAVSLLFAVGQERADDGFELLDSD